MQPTVGRIVHYHHSRNHPPQLAAVAKVHSATCVNVALWDELGRPVADPPTSVRFVGPEDQPPVAGPYCVFPPRE